MRLGFEDRAETPPGRRSRDIEDIFGTSLTLSVEPHPNGATIVIERWDTEQTVVMDRYGAEILSAILLMARMHCSESTSETIIEEHLFGRFPMTISLIEDSSPIVTVTTPEDECISLPVHVWDRLYVELTMACIHAREMTLKGAKMH